MHSSFPFPINRRSFGQLETMSGIGGTLSWWISFSLAPSTSIIDIVAALYRWSTGLNWQRGLFSSSSRAAQKQTVRLYKKARSAMNNGLVYYKWKRSCFSPFRALELLLFCHWCWVLGHQVSRTGTQRRRSVSIENVDLLRLIEISIETLLRFFLSSVFHASACHRWMRHINQDRSLFYARLHKGGSSVVFQSRTS